VKIVVSLDEAREAIRARFALPGHAHIVIGRGRKKPVAKNSFVTTDSETRGMYERLKPAVRSTVDAVDRFLSDNHKADAIRFLRNELKTSLKSAKEIVDSWESVRQHTFVKGYVPIPIWADALDTTPARWT
jgi:ribosomal protein L7/L12